MRRFILGVMLSMCGVGFAMADEAGHVSDTLRKMKKDLNLTEEQARRISPIIKEFQKSRRSYLEQAMAEPIINRSAIRIQMKEFKQNEQKALAAVLNEEQIQKWVAQENRKSRLNAGGPEFQLGQDVTITTQGADLKF